MPESFSERLAKKAAAAKQQVNDSLPASNALQKATLLTGPNLPLNQRLPAIPGVISTDIDGRIAGRDTNKVGLSAFFNRKGEEARTKLADAQSAHALALSKMEEAQQTARTVAFKSATLDQDLLRAKILEVKEAELMVSAAMQQIEFVSIQTKLVKEAAERGYSFETDEELRKKKAEIDHELHKIEREKQIEFEHEQRMLHAKVGSAIDYANTPHLIWMRKNEDLKTLFKEVDEAEKNTNLSATARQRTLGRLEKQIQKLEAELDGLSGQTVSADSGA